MVASSASNASLCRRNASVPTAGLSGHGGKSRQYLSGGGNRKRFHRPLGLISRHESEYRESFLLQSVASIFGGCRPWKLDQARNAMLVAERGRTKRLPAKRPALNAPDRKSTRLNS